MIVGLVPWVNLCEARQVLVHETYSKSIYLCFGLAHINIVQALPIVVQHFLLRRSNFLKSEIVSLFIMEKIIKSAMEHSPALNIFL